MYIYVCIYIYTHTQTAREFVTKSNYSDFLFQQMGAINVGAKYRELYKEEIERMQQKVLEHSLKDTMQEGYNLTNQEIPRRKAGILNIHESVEF